MAVHLPNADMNPARIAIVGPESTGKSELSERLAEYYGVGWVPEYARTYLDELGRPYEKHDLLKIARGQLKWEDEKARSGGEYLFCDTNLIVIKIWSLIKYKECDPWILTQIRQRRYDFYLLTYIDLPWEEDPQREHPDLREYLFNFYEKEVKNLKIPYAVVRGSHRKRLENAVKAVDVHFQNKR